MYAYLIAEIGGAKLVIDNSKATEKVDANLKKANIEIMPYNLIISKIEILAAHGAALWLDTPSVIAVIAYAYEPTGHRKQTCWKIILHQTTYLH